MKRKHIGKRTDQCKPVLFNLFVICTT